MGDIIKFLCIDPANCNKTIIDAYISNCKMSIECLTSAPKECFKISGSGSWESSLIWCCHDCGVLIWWYFCPLCVAVRTQAKGIDQTCEAVCCTQMFISVCAPCWAIASRKKIREKYGIKGSMCLDCLALYFCGPCATIQMANQTKPGIPCQGEHTIAAPPVVQDIDNKASGYAQKTDSK